MRQRVLSRIYAGSALLRRGVVIADFHALGWPGVDSRAILRRACASVAVALVPREEASRRVVGRRLLIVLGR